MMGMKHEYAHQSVEPLKSDFKEEMIRVLTMQEREFNENVFNKISGIIDIEAKPRTLTTNNYKNHTKFLHSNKKARRKRK